MNRRTTSRTRWSISPLPLIGRAARPVGPRKGRSRLRAAGGLIGASISAALRIDGYALTAALIGGIPLGALGMLSLSWFGWLFGRMNRLRHGSLVGGSLGLLGAGTLGAVAGLSVWAFPWSLAGAILGAMLQSFLTRPELRPGAVPRPRHRLAGRHPLAGRPHRLRRRDGRRVLRALVGTVLGVFLIPALLAWLTELPSLLQRRRRR